MGIAPFVFETGKTRNDYALTGRESIDFPDLSGNLSARMKITARIRYPDRPNAEMPLYLMILTADEIAYFKNGGILPYVLRNLLAV